MATSTSSSGNVPSDRHECLFPLQMVCERSDVFASSCAIARAFPIFSRRSSSSRRNEKKHVTVEFVIIGQDNGTLDVTELEVQHYAFFFFFILIFFSLKSTVRAFGMLHGNGMLNAKLKVFFLSVSLQCC